MDYSKIAKYLAGESVYQEKSDIEKRVKEDPVFCDELEQLASIWKDVGYARIEEKGYQERQFKKLFADIETRGRQSKGFRMKLYIPVAATVLLLATSVIFFKLNRAIYKSGDEKKKIVLADNSTVILNKNSILEYYKWFNVRNVTLNGEAFFDIQPDEDIPFQVFSGKTEIKVLGTKFYVNTFHSDEKVQVKVTSGKVMLSSGVYEGKNKSLILTQGEMGEMNYVRNVLVKYNNFDQNEVAWNTEKLVFKAFPLNQVFKLLEKNYDVKIRTDISDIDAYKFTGIFDHTTLEIALETICNSFNLKKSYNEDKRLVKFYR